MPSLQHPAQDPVLSGRWGEGNRPFQPRQHRQACKTDMCAAGFLQGCQWDQSWFRKDPQTMPVGSRPLPWLRQPHPGVPSPACVCLTLCGLSSSQAPRCGTGAFFTFSRPKGHLQSHTNHPALHLSSPPPHLWRHLPPLSVFSLWPRWCAQCYCRWIQRGPASGKPSALPCPVSDSH